MSCIMRQQIFNKDIWFSESFELLIFLFKILGQHIELTQRTHASGSEEKEGDTHWIN